MDMISIMICNKIYNSSHLPTWFASGNSGDMKEVYFKLFQVMALKQIHTCYNKLNDYLFLLQ